MGNKTEMEVSHSRTLGNNNTSRVSYLYNNDTYPGLFVAEGALVPTRAVLDSPLTGDSELTVLVALSRLVPRLGALNTCNHSNSNNT